MRSAHSSFARNTGKESALDHYLGNLSVALVRAKAERDIRDARAAAEAAIRVRSSFLENMNHELRTPLNAIIGFAGMLQQAETYSLSNDQRATYAEYILQSADLLLGHINTILETAALDNGSVAPSQEVSDIYDLVDRAIERVQVQASTKKITLLCSHHLESRKTGKPVVALPPVWADEERIGQALDHLLLTSIKSCDKGGKILLRMQSTQQGMIDILVRDNGEGFDEEEIRQALTAFGNVYRGLGRPFAGPGVGISIAKTFIEMQGGVFAIRSRKNKGTLITISLPCATTEQITQSDFGAQSLEDAVSDVSEPPGIHADTQTFAKSA